MQQCQECGLLAINLFTVQGGQRLCDYCSTAVKTVKVTHKPREYNDTKLAIKRKYGTIKNWAERKGFAQATVNRVLNDRVACYDQYSDIQIAILVQLMRDGLTESLLTDKYIDSEWI